jgi:D-inositol-3-phosphate glycosyltransferase
MSAVRSRIGLVVPSLEQGGGVPSVADFICQVIERNDAFDFRLISLSMSAVDEISLEVRRPASWWKGVRSDPGVWRGRSFTRVGVFASELEFQRFRPRAALAALLEGCDLIQVVCGSPAWANAVVGLGKPVSLQVATRAKVERRRRDARPRNLIGWWRKAMTQVTDYLDDRALGRVDAIQLENLWMLDYSRELNKANKSVDIRYAPPGVNAKLFRPLSERPSLRNSYILCVGRLDDPRKNIGLLLQAFYLLPASLAHVRLVTAGSGRPPPDYWACVETMGLQDRVSHIHMPKTEELVQLYQKAAVFALASDEEGLGIVVLEAMACGLPVVATRCGGPDGIISDCKDGFLVPLDDAPAMAERLAALCADANLNRNIGQRARHTIEERYAEEVVGQAFVEVWERLLKKAERH